MPEQDAATVPGGFIANWLGPCVAGVLTLVIFHLSLLTTSTPVSDHQSAVIARTIADLEAKGFAREAFMLRNVVSFRNSDNWLNGVSGSENAYASTNFPFFIVTVYPDFFEKATDDTERAMVLLHEAQHLRGRSERQAYAYVWRSRRQLGWTTLSHGTTPTFITIEQQTRDHAPELFTCPQLVWNDCTETVVAKR